MICLSFLLTVGCRIRKYKKYDDDPSVQVPKLTKNDRIKHVKLSTSHVPSPILQAPSHSSDLRQEVPNTVEAPACENSEILMEERHPARDDHEYTVILPEEIDADESEEVGPPSCRQWDDECDIDDDVDSITSSTSEVSWESGVSSEEDSDDSADIIQNETTTEFKTTFSAQETACMAILALISRHCITTEAAKDIIDLVKVLSPENETLQSLSYTDVQRVC